MVVAFVHGLQGANPRYWQTASLLKHFLANSNENGRNSSSSDFDEQLFRDYYSVPFRMGIVDGGARAFMTAYNAWNGIPMIVNPVLKKVAVNEWGQDGIICTDGGAFGLLVTAHRYTTNYAVAAAAVVKAGISIFLDRYQPALSNAVKENLISETDIDESVKRNLRVMIKLGLLDPPDNNPYAKIGQASEPEPWLSDEHKMLARRVTQESIVLLKNSKRLLPLDKTRLKSIAVIGPRANQVLLDWYSGRPPYTVTPLEGIAKQSRRGRHSKFCHQQRQRRGGETRKISRRGHCLRRQSPDRRDASINGQEVALPSYASREGQWIASPLQLEDEELIKQIYAANPKTIVVLVSSFPYAINWTQKHVPAIVHLTHCSEEQGNALADVLFGDYNPAGRLVQTWPQSLDQLPPMMDYNIRDGRTYMYFKGKPLYPFGYGLSYTKFAYSNLKTSSSTLNRDGSLTVSVDVKNTGTRAGDEVVQLYVKHLNSKMPRPQKELKGFQRVNLQAGEQKTVEIPLPAKLLAYWNSDKHAFEIEPDKIQIEAGASSTDIRASKTIEVN